MILIINTSGNGIDLIMGDKFMHRDAEKQAIALPVAVEDFMKQNNVKMTDLTAVGVVVGPDLLPVSVWELHTPKVWESG